jgi:hypothetical protein
MEKLKVCYLFVFTYKLLFLGQKRIVIYFILNHLNCLFACLDQLLVTFCLQQLHTLDWSQVNCIADFIS